MLFLLFNQELIFDVDVAFRFIIPAKEYLNCSKKLLDLKVIVIEKVPNVLDCLSN